MGKTILNLADAKVEDLVWVWEEHRVWICLLCRAGIPPMDGGIERHYRKKHKLKGSALQRVLAHEKQLSLTLNNPHVLELPEKGSTAIEQLPVLSGLQCPYQPCTFLTIHPNSLTSHYSCPSKGHRGVVGCGDGLPARQGLKVSLQSFSKQRFARYWIVNTEKDNSQEVAGDDENLTDDSGYNSGFDDMLSQYGEKLACEEDKRRRTGEAPGGADVDDPWVTWTGWAEHFQEKDLGQISRLGKGPMAESRAKTIWYMDEKRRQRRLRALAESFERVMARCTRRLKLVPRETLRWLNSIDPKTPHGRPFQLKDHESSMDDYKRYAVRYLCYCFGAWEMGRERAQAELGVQFTDVQWDRLSAVVERLMAIDLREESPTTSSGGGARGGAQNRAQASSGRARAEEPTDQQELLDEGVFEFWIASIKHRVAFRIFRNPSIHFTAVLGIDAEKLSYKRAADYTGQLAGLVWCVRLLLLEYVFKDQSDDPEELDLAVLDIFQEEHDEWLVDGGHSPFSKMIEYMAYGKGHREKEGGLPKVMWEDDGTALRFKGERIAVADFQRAGRVVVEEAEELLDKVMFGRWGAAKESIDMNRIVDSLTFEGSGRSFATNHKNKWLQPGYERVATLGKDKLWREGRGWKRSNVVEYLATLRRFKLAMMLVAHIWLGQPGRGPEFLTMRHCDSQQLMRNSFVFDGQFMTITDRDKNRAIRGVGRKVARFLPELPGKMMVAYIAWLIPLERMLEEEVGIQGPSKSLDGFLWKDASKGRWNTELLTDRMKLLTAAEVGVALGVADYRHVAIEMGRKIQGIMIQALEIEANGDEAQDMDFLSGELRKGRKTENVWDLQATHGSIIAGRHYALDIRFPYQLQPRMVANFREISRLWHIWMERGLHRAGTKRAADEMHIAHGDERPAKTRVVAGLSMDGCNCKCACNAGSQKSMNDEDEKYERYASSAVNSDRQVRGPGQKPRDGKEDSWHSELKVGLQRLLGKGADWKSVEQGKGMEKVMGLQDGEALTIVLPTGGGKSIFFMLPSLVEESGTTVVVVPFMALVDDLVDRARRDFGLDCVKWLPSSATGRVERQPDARLVVVSADRTNTTELSAYVTSIQRRGLLRRIFFDECHTAILDLEYRKNLESLRYLHKYGCPVVMLTATLPVRMEKWFRRFMLIEDAPIIRAKTTKSNIQYRVVRVKAGCKTTLEEGVIQEMRNIQSKMTKTQKGIIYCRSTRQCEELAERIGCTFHHSGQGMKESERRAAREAWAKGQSESRWIVASTGMGTGVDVEGIVGVIHVEEPYGLVDFIQQTGRGGRRKGEVVHSIIVLSGRAARLDKTSSDITRMNFDAMQSFIGRAGCRRVLVGEFMDGEGRDCREAGAERCDQCQEQAVDQEDMGRAAERNGQREEETRDRLREHLQAEAKGQMAQERWLDEVGKKCGVCYVRWSRHGREELEKHTYGHKMEQCSFMQVEEYSAWRRQIEFPESSCCWGCGLRRAQCESIGLEASSGRCRYRDQVYPVMMMPMKSKTLGRMMFEEFGVDASKPGEYLEWICRKRATYGREATNGFAVWDLLVQMCMSKIKQY